MTRLQFNQHRSWIGWVSAFLVFVLVGGCTRASSTPVPLPTSSRQIPTPTIQPGDQALPENEIATLTLSSLKQLDDYPLYTMRFFGNYPTPSFLPPETTGLSSPGAYRSIWGCALFAALGDPGSRLYGRNFDWRFSPALLLFTDPPDGYASVSMVDIEYLGFARSRSKNLANLPLKDRKPLLGAPALPFDGMNEKGLAIGMAAVPPGEMRLDPDKKTIDQLAVMREILDHSSTVEEAVKILANYNIDMGNVPLHYLIASAAGNSALVEFYRGKMVVFQNEMPWQVATNFLVASTGGRSQGECPRFDRISHRLQELGGQIAVQDALDLLADVSQDSPQAQSNTQWSIVYDMAGGDVYIIMGRNYSGKLHTLKLNLSGQ